MSGTDRNSDKRMKVFEAEVLLKQKLPNGDISFGDFPGQFNPPQNDPNFYPKESLGILSESFLALNAANRDLPSPKKSLDILNLSAIDIGRESFFNVNHPYKLDFTKNSETSSNIPTTDSAEFYNAFLYSSKFSFNSTDNQKISPIFKENSILTKSSDDLMDGKSFDEQKHLLDSIDQPDWADWESSSTSNVESPVVKKENVQKKLVQMMGMQPVALNKRIHQNKRDDSNFKQLSDVINEKAGLTNSNRKDAMELMKQLANILGININQIYIHKDSANSSNEDNKSAEKRIKADSECLIKKDNKLNASKSIDRKSISKESNRPTKQATAKPPLKNPSKAMPMRAVLPISLMTKSGEGKQSTPERANQKPNSLLPKSITPVQKLRPTAASTPLFSNIAPKQANTKLVKPATVSPLTKRNSSIGTTVGNNVRRNSFTEGVSKEKNNNGAAYKFRRSFSTGKWNGQSTETKATGTGALFPRRAHSKSFGKENQKPFV